MALVEQKVVHLIRQPEGSADQMAEEMVEEQIIIMGPPLAKQEPAEEAEEAAAITKTGIAKILTLECQAAPAALPSGCT